MNDVKEMCRRFALLHIAHWRKASGPKSRAVARTMALHWLAAMKGRA